MLDIEYYHPAESGFELEAKIWKRLGIPFLIVADPCTVKKLIDEKKISEEDALTYDSCDQNNGSNLDFVENHLKRRYRKEYKKCASGKGKPSKTMCILEKIRPEKLKKDDFLLKICKKIVEKYGLKFGCEQEA